MELNIGSGVVVDVAALADAFPKDAINAYARAIMHKATNEASSAVLRKLGLKDFDSADQDEVDEAFRTFRIELAEKLAAGKSPVNAPGAPRGSGLEKITFEVAAKFARDGGYKMRNGKVSAGLLKQGLWPKNDEEDTVVDFQGKLMNREQLTKTILDFYRDQVEAKARIVYEERKADAAAKKANGSKVERKSAIDQDIEDLI